MKSNQCPFLKVDPLFYIDITIFFTHTHKYTHSNIAQITKTAAMNNLPIDINTQTTEHRGRKSFHSRKTHGATPKLGD